MVGTFKDLEGAAVYRTDHEDFEVLFLPQPKTFDQLKAIERRDGQRYLYRFKGPPQPWHGNLVDSAFRISFIKNRSMLFVVQNQRAVVCNAGEARAL